MAKQKFYAVKVGLNPGIYYTWPECQEQVKGYPGAVFKSFLKLEDAEMYLSQKNLSLKIVDNEKELVNVLDFDYVGERVFVDGSFNEKTNTYGAGIAWVDKNGNVTEKHSIAGNDTILAKSRNVAGEVLAASEAISQAVIKGLNDITIICDYEGLAKWAIEGPDQWKRDTAIGRFYDQYLEYAKENNLKLHFIWVRGHIGVEHNELVDFLAKKACGIK